MTEIGVWHVTRQGPRKLIPSRLNLEKELEEWIENEPDLLEAGLKIVGRQVKLAGGKLDLLGLDLQGNFVVIEIKRGEVNRRAISQAIDYASSITSMPYDELAEQVANYTGKQTSLKTLLEDRGGEIGDSQEPRSAKLYVVGTGKQQGLERMVDFLAIFQLPISVVSFEVFEVGKGQRMLVRELTDAEANLPQTDIRKQSVDRLATMADQYGVGNAFQALREAAERHGLYARLWPKCVMYTPPSNRTRMLFSVWTRSKFPAKIRVFVGTDVFPEFYPIRLKEARACLGARGWRHMTLEQVNKFIAGLDKLFEAIPVEE